MNEKQLTDVIRKLRLKAARFAFCIIGIGIASFALKMPFEVQKQLYACAAFACLTLPERP